MLDWCYLGGTLGHPLGTWASLWGCPRHPKRASAGFMESLEASWVPWPSPGWFLGRSLGLATASIDLSLMYRGCLGGHGAFASVWLSEVKAGFGIVCIYILHSYFEPLGRSDLSTVSG